MLAKLCLVFIASDSGSPSPVSRHPKIHAIRLTDRHNYESKVK
jgi:hypothetical protein